MRDGGCPHPSQKNKDMIDKFINYLTTIKGYSPNTAQAYERDLRHFASWARANLTDARWSNITREDIDKYVGYMASADLMPATTNRRLSAISSLYGFFKREGLEADNPCKYESRRKIAETVPNTIPLKELQAAYDQSIGMTKVMLGILSTTGIRIQELLDMTYEDIDFEKGAIKIHGKGKRERVVYTSHQYLKDLEECVAIGCHGTIFDIEQREARKRIWGALRPYSHAKQLSPHAIRHTFATHQAASGTNCSTLSTILGHKDLNTTQRYIDLGQSDTRQACLEYALLH